MRTRLPVKLKVAVVTAALTFGILCLFAMVIGAVAEQRIRAGFDDDLRANAADLLNRLGDEISGPEDEQVLVAASLGDTDIRVLDRNGEVAFPPGVPPLVPFGVEGFADVNDYRVLSSPLTVSHGGPGQSLTGPLLDDRVADLAGVVQYAEPLSGVERTIARVRLFLGFGVLGGTLLAFLGGLYVAQRAMRPIVGLTRAAREVARTRDPDVTLPKPEANDEVSDLANTFEDMLQQLSAARGETEQTLDRQRQFVADASHELRTPLTSILANLELLESELAGEQRDMAESALRSSRRMRRLVTDLLLLARADAGRESPRTTLDLARVTREAAEEAGALSADHPLSLDLDGPVTIEGVADDLHRLVGNLVENALLHSPPGTPVTVSVRRAGDAAVLEVADRGPGVVPVLRERVFERFSRGSGDRAASGGTGLGLAIVKAVADAHGGSVDLREAPGGGARFVVRLPVAATPAAPPERSDRSARVFES